MSVGKVTVSIGSDLLRQLDRLVSERVFANRSQAVDLAVKEKLARLNSSRLVRACEMLDPVEERTFAETGASADLEEWPEYSEVTSFGPNVTRLSAASKPSGGLFWC